MFRWFFRKNRESITVIYSGSCQGWVNTADANITSGTAISFEYNVRYLVVAGGGGGGATCGANGGGAGAGAGGFRTVCSANFAVTQAQSFPITVGAGGGGGGATCGANGGWSYNLHFSGRSYSLRFRGWSYSLCFSGWSYGL